MKNKKKNKKKKYFLFKILMTLYFISISVICIFWWIFKEILENQDLYRNKGDFLHF